jgi:hypothetical protein
MSILLRAGGLVLAATAVLTACAQSPTNQEQVCASFDELGVQLLEGNGVIGNPLFHKVDRVAGMAERYEGTPSLAADAAALRRIADSDSTSGEELMEASTSIANLCGHPLGLNALFGDR